MNRNYGDSDSWVEYFRTLKNNQERKHWELNSQAHQLRGRTVNTPPFTAFTLLSLSTNTDSGPLAKHRHHNNMPFLHFLRVKWLCLLFYYHVKELSLCDSWYEYSSWGSPLKLFSFFPGSQLLSSLSTTTNKRVRGRLKHCHSVKPQTLTLISV